MGFFYKICSIVCLIGVMTSMKINLQLNSLQSRNISSGNITMSQPDNIDQNKTYKFSIIDIFSPFFYTNLNGKPGRDFIALKSSDGFFLGCDQKGELNVRSKNITKDNLFIPVVSAQVEKFALRSWHGGYVSYNQSSWNCLNRRMENSSEFVVDKKVDIKKFNLNVSNVNQTVTLKFEKGYLGVENNQLKLIEKLNKNAIWFSASEENLALNRTGLFYFEWLLLD